MRQAFNAQARYGANQTHASARKDNMQGSGSVFKAREVEVFNGYKERLKESLMQEQQRSLVSKDAIS